MGHTDWVKGVVFCMMGHMLGKGCVEDLLKCMIEVLIMSTDLPENNRLKSKT
jgi:hypothetical protein